MTKLGHHFNHKEFEYVRQGELNHNLTHDVQICSLLQNFSTHVHERVEKLSSATEELDRRADIAELEVTKTNLAFMQFGDHHTLHFGISGEVSRRDGAFDLNTTQNNSSSASMGEEDDIDQLVIEEEIAIKDGIAALNLFHDSQRTQHSYESDHFFGMENEGDASDAPHYYGSASADVFNQRPLPFIVGSKAFMQSHDGGIGSR